jgi:hypothetical protein
MVGGGQETKGHEQEPQEGQKGRREPPHTSRSTYGCHPRSHEGNQRGEQQADRWEQLGTADAGSKCQHDTQHGRAPQQLGDGLCQSGGLSNISHHNARLDFLTPSGNRTRELLPTIGGTTP